MGEVNMEELSRATQTSKFEIQIQPFTLQIAIRYISMISDDLLPACHRTRGILQEFIAVLREAKQIEDVSNEKQECIDCREPGQEWFDCGAILCKQCFRERMLMCNKCDKPAIELLDGSEQYCGVHMKEGGMAHLWDSIPLEQ